MNFCMLFIKANLQMSGLFMNLGNDLLKLTEPLVEAINE